MTSPNPLVGNLSSPLLVLFLPFLGRRQPPASPRQTINPSHSIDWRIWSGRRRRTRDGRPIPIFYGETNPPPTNECWSTYVKTGIESFSHFCFRPTWPRSNDAVLLLLFCLFVHLVFYANSEKSVVCLFVLSYWETKKQNSPEMRKFEFICFFTNRVSMVHPRCTPRSRCLGFPYIDGF